MKGCSEELTKIPRFLERILFKPCKSRIALLHQKNLILNPIGDVNRKCMNFIAKNLKPLSSCNFHKVFEDLKT